MNRLLIANRGEIAIRIARAAADLGIESVAVYSEDDSTSLHVSRTHKAHALDGKGPRAYLDSAGIINAARESGADAIHPGYGFLSERADFAEAVTEAGLVLVGPSAETLSLFGDKGRARQLALDCNVPVLPGSEGSVTLEEAGAFFEELPAGTAMILKAVAGGGGRGMRIIQEAAELPEAYERASSEAQAGFGNGALYCEAFLPEARHLEVQIIGDGTGAVSHLHERECSIQRRHQKLVEIAPSPTLDPEVRQHMQETAVRMGEAVNYQGLGTIEFLLDQTGRQFFFIEANARLQVEHTVTEEVLGLDLVQAQLKVAAGQTLADLKLAQKDIPAPRGFAIQTRINMETMKPDGSTRPSGGTLTAFEPPTGPGLRTDSFGYAGYKTSPAFDSLLAKLITHSTSPDYADAVRRAYRALCEFRIEGVGTNLGFLKNLLRHDAFVRNEVTTGFVEVYIAELAAPADHPVLYGIRNSADTTAAAPAETPGASNDPLAVLDFGKGGARQGSAPAQVFAPAAGQAPDGTAVIEAPMQGTIVSLDIREGDEVWVGKPVLVMEAMKMEHVVASKVSGVVQRLLVQPGETVFEDHPLIWLEEREIAAAGHEAEAETDPDHIRPDLRNVLDRKAAGHDENRPDAVEKRHARGHRTARENVDDLCDEGTFVEYGGVVLAAQRRRRSMDDLIARTTGDGMVCGLGHVNGDRFPEDRSRAMIMSYDYMVLAGTQGALNHYKKDRMFEIAEEYRLPTVLFSEGGGGRPGDTDVTGVAGLDCLAFTYFAKLSGLVPLIGISNGYCFAGNAVLLACCDVIIATEGSNIGIGGPAMIEGGGLGIFSPDEVGPVEDQVPNGVIDILVKDEAEAVQVAKTYLSYFQGAIEEWEAPDPRHLRSVVPENRLRWYDMRKVIEGIADTGSILELRKDWAIGIITAFIRVEGKPVGVIANEPGHLSGAIDAPGADKAARFLQLCDAFDIPVVTLVDCPGIMVGPEVEKTAIVRHAGRMFNIGANVDIPLMSFIIRKGYGLGAQAMTGTSFKASLFTVSWPTGEFGGMSLEGSVKLGFRKELQAIEDPDDRRKAYEEMVAKAYERGSAVNMASHFEIDDVIDPAETRKWIVAGLSSLPPKKQREGKKRNFVDTW